MNRFLILILILFSFSSTAFAETDCIVDGVRRDCTATATATINLEVNIPSDGEVAAANALCDAFLSEFVTDVIVVIRANCDRPIAVINLLLNGETVTHGIPLSPAASEVHFLTAIAAGLNAFSITGEGRTVVEGRKVLILK